MDGLIYYIEDEEDIAWGVREYLQKKGFHVEVLGTAGEAKAALERKLPSLALVDWNLPDGSGDQLCRWVRGRWKELPVIFLTVRGESGDIVRGFENGADDYISKPFDLAVLHARIRALLKRAGQGGDGPLKLWSAVLRYRDGEGVLGRPAPAGQSGGVPAVGDIDTESEPHRHQAEPAGVHLGQQRKLCQ